MQSQYQCLGLRGRSMVLAFTCFFFQCFHIVILVSFPFELALASSEIQLCPEINSACHASQGPAQRGCVDGV